jgi:hypothetical protein
MANALYDKGREGFLAGDIDWDANTIKVVFIDEADDTINLATDEDLADRATASRVPAGTDGTQSNHPTLGSKTTTAGVADAADATFSALTGDVSESIDIYVSTGTDTSSRLIANIDTATGLPLTPNGGDVTIAWDSGANKIFKL